MIENYLSAYHDRSIDKIVYWTRSEDGKRHQRFAKPPYYFYHPDKNGIYEGLDGVKLSKKDFHDKEEFEIGCRQYSSKYESDIQPVSKFLMDNFYGVKAPEVVYGLFDIEVNYSSKIGFSSPKNPYAEINAITIYRSDLKNFITLAIPPPGWSGWDSSASDLNLENILLFDTEKELLDAFLTLADEVDVLSGWNSDFFDVPYVGKRVELVLGKSHLKRLGYNGGPEPKWGEAKKFKHSSATEMVLDIRSKIHLDYMRLFKKFSQGGRESFSLAAIADSELDIPKLHYEGTLENLYKTDFTTFIRYNIRDTEILLKFEEKFKYIALANTMAHEATVEFDAVFGSVKLIDTAIINYSRHELKKIVYDRRPKPKASVEGALVVSPKPGFYKNVCTIDINSLYPSTYRSLNLSPEKIIGQFVGYESDWRTIADANQGDTVAQDKILTLSLENTEETISQPAKEFLKYFKENKLAVSAYGTILDQGNGQGLLPAILTFWFKNRKELQAKKKEFGKLARERLVEVCNDKTDAEYLRLRNEEDYFDMIQNIRKLLLNSLYGATLNEFCKFADPRLGASTTGSGRQITQEMGNYISKLINDTDEYKLEKTVEYDKDGEQYNIYKIECPKTSGPIYGDTDSVSRDSIVEINGVSKKIEDHYENLLSTNTLNINGKKELLFVSDSFTNTYVHDDVLKPKKIKAIYRHKTDKQLYRITTSSGKSVIITEDHSIMIERDGILQECKPTELQTSDIVIETQ